jgi:hypothetical protein
VPEEGRRKEEKRVSTLGDGSRHHTRRGTNGVVKVPSGEGLLDRHDVARVRIRLDDDLDSFAELSELVPNVSDSLKGLVLDVVL